jgi:hypothetical protein
VEGERWEGGKKQERKKSRRAEVEKFKLRNGIEEMKRKMGETG